MGAKIFEIIFDKAPVAELAIVYFSFDIGGLGLVGDVGGAQRVYKYKQALNKVVRTVEDVQGASKLVRGVKAAEETNVLTGKAAEGVAKETGTILWSGPGARNAAEWLANNTGGTTLEMTQLGARTELATVGMDYLTQARPIWQAASKRFVQSASGEVRIVLSGSANPSSIYFTTEWKALLQNPNVTGVKFIHIR